MKLALHIGASGLRGIQPFLARHRKTLLDAGIYYPAIFGSEDHSDLVKYAFASRGSAEGDNPRNPFLDVEQQEAFRKKLKADLKRAVAESRRAGCRTWLMSDENLCSQIISFTMVKRVRNLFARHFSEVTIHIHLRPQVEMLADEAARRAREGRLSTHATFAGPEFSPQVKHLDYNGLVLRWEKLFGAENVRLTPFRRQPSILGHLCHELGVDVGVFRKDRPEEHAPPGWRAIALANALNQTSPHGARLDVDAIASPEPLSVSSEFAGQIQAKFDAGNAKLAGRRPDIMTSDLKPGEAAGSDRPTMALAEAPCLFADQLSEVLQRKDRELLLERYLRLLAEFRQAAAEARFSVMSALRTEINQLATLLLADGVSPARATPGGHRTAQEEPALRAASGHGRFEANALKPELRIVSNQLAPDGTV